MTDPFHLIGYLIAFLVFLIVIKLVIAELPLPDNLRRVLLLVVSLLGFLWLLRILGLF